MPSCLPIPIATPNFEIDAINPVVRYRQMQDIFQQQLANAKLFIAVGFSRNQPLDPQACPALTRALQLRKVCDRDAFVRGRIRLACIVVSLTMDGGAHGTRLIDVEDGVEIRGGILAITLI